MAATLDDLSADLQRFFAQKFPPSGEGGPGSIVLVFDSLGTPLDPVEFTGSGQGAAEDLLAHQRAAQLADQLPSANALASGWYLARSGSRLSTWYEAALDASSPLAQTPDALTAFAQLKAAAQRMLDENKLAVASGTAVGGSTGTSDASGTHDSYYATTMSPIDWFLPDTTSFGTYDVASTDQPPPPPQTDPIPPPRFRLRVAAGALTGDLGRYVARATIAAPAPNVRLAAVAAAASDASTASPSAAAPAASGPASGPASSPLRESAIGRLGRLEASPISRFPAGPTARALGQTSLAEQAFSPVAGVAGPAEPAHDAVAETLVGRALLSQVALDSPDAPAQPDGAVQPVKTGLVDFKHIVFIPEPIDAGAVAGATTEQPSTSNGFHVTFDYCQVRFDRPWWNDVFANAHGWSVFGYDPGAIASGSAAAPTGQISLITVGMVVIRDLTITATWSDADVAALPNTTSLGPFCIAGATFDSSKGMLRRPGLQAIAWLCQVPPVLPPPPPSSSTTGDSSSSTTADASTTPADAPSAPDAPATPDAPVPADTSQPQPAGTPG